MYANILTFKLLKCMFSFDILNSPKAEKDDSNLDQCRVQIDVVGHDDGAHNSHSLLQFRWATTGAVGQEHPLQQFPLVWLHNHILKQNKMKKKTSRTKSNRAQCSDHTKVNHLDSLINLYLITKAEGHDSDEEAKERFQLPEAC